MDQLRDFLKTNIDQFHSRILSAYKITNSAAVNLYIIRDDGMNFYSTYNGEKINHRSALMAGLWKASQVLGLEKDLEDDNLVLSLGTSSSGYMILPINLGERSFLLTLEHSEIDQLGKLRFEFKNIKNHLETYEEPLEKEKTSVKTNKDGSLLFNNVTDAEIDRMFQGISL